jgi:integrase
MPRKRPTLFEVRYSEKPNRDNHWRIVGFIDGKRTQYWYKSEKEAKVAAADKNAEITAYGTQVALSPADRMRASNAADRLTPYGKTIDDAVNFYTEYLQRQSASVPFATFATEVRTEFKRRLEANEVSDRNAESFENALRKLEIQFASRIVSEISVKDVRDWLTGMPLAPKTRNKVRGYARQIFGLAVEYGHATVNPVVGTKKFRERSSEEREISILTSEETAKLFGAADPLVIPFLALHFFTGIRRATLEKIGWADVNMAERRVIVPRYKGKNDKRYRVTLSENLIEWLTPYVRESGAFLAPSRANQSRDEPSKRRTRELVLAAAEKAGVTLPDNAGRHTFISMHVAHHESIDKTALESDNSSEIIKRDYLNIVTREDAAKFWEIRP